MTMADRVREHIRALNDEFSCRGVASVLGLAQSDQVRKVIYEMTRRGEAERLIYGYYQYIGAVSLKGSCRVLLPNIYRAMHVKKSFATTEVAMLSGASLDYVQRVAKKLTGTGALERICRRAKRQYGREWVYRVRHPDNFYREFVLPVEKNPNGKSKGQE